MSQHTQDSSNWIIYLTAVVLFVGLVVTPGYWLMGRWKHHQAIEVLKKVCNEVEVVTPDSGFKGWVCRQFDGKLAFAFEKVTSINAAYAKLNQDQWQLLELLPKVEHLNLSCSNITDVGLSHLSGLTNLEGLWLNGTQITDTGLSHLLGLTNLKKLYLYKTQITDDGLSHLSGLTSLEELVLGKTQITDAAINRLKKKIPGLRVLR